MNLLVGDLTHAIDYTRASWVWQTPDPRDRRMAIREVTISRPSPYVFDGTCEWTWENLFGSRELRHRAEHGGLVVFNGCNPSTASLVRLFGYKDVEFHDDVVSLHRDFHIMVLAEHCNAKDYRKAYGVKRCTFLRDFWEVNK